MSTDPDKFHCDTCGKDVTPFRRDRCSHADCAVRPRETAGPGEAYRAADWPCDPVMLHEERADRDHWH